MTAIYTDTNTMLDQDDEVAQEGQEDPYYLKRMQ